MFKFPFSRKKFKSDIEPQEIFLDQLAQKKEEELGITEKRLEKPLSKRVLQILWGLFLLLGFLLFLKTFQLQVLEGKELKQDSEANKFIIQSLQATRGVIYDRNSEQLVFNRPTFDLVLDESKLPQSNVEKERVRQQVAQILGGEPPENLSHEKLILFEAKIDELPGFSIQRNLMRDYKEGEIFSHLLGYTGKITAEELETLPGDYSINDMVGRVALEKSYEQALARQPGKLQLEEDAFGNVLSKKIVSLPQPGKSLVLYLDADLQRKTYYALKQGIKAAGGLKGAAVILDAKTGGVLGLVSFPGFDNNLFNQKTAPEELRALLNDPQESLFNRVIAGRYLTGSTIKPLIASAGLEEKIINPEKKIDCQGYIAIANRWDPSSPTIKEDWAVHGLTDMRKAIAVSCNVYFYTIGGGYQNQEGLGPTRIKKYLELFGWGDKTGIDLSEEAEGFIPDKQWKKETWHESWWDGDTYNLSIGQGYLLITPLEVAASFVAIANGGKLLEPHIVHKIIDGSADSMQVVEEVKPKIIRENFITPENLQIVREGMREATIYGSSAQWLGSLPVSLGAKTGTAQTSKQGYYHNWVTVFAPYDDPDIVLTIMIEDVKGVQAVVLPIAREILTWYFTQ